MLFLRKSEKLGER